jgi:hypothetical protein
VGQGLPAISAGTTCQHTQVEFETVARTNGVGMLVTQYSAASHQDVLVEFAGLLILAEFAQIGGEPAGQAKS